MDFQKTPLKMVDTNKNKNQIRTKNMYSELETRITNSNENCYYLNLGYWKNTNQTKVACEQMIDQVIQFAPIQENQTLLDVGYGYGDQDIYLAKKIPHITIHGLNIIDNQVKKAQEKVIENEISDQIFLEKGDATELKYNDNTFDTIIAIESAFQFNTREKFFEEAYRTLKKNGILCLADCLPNAKTKNSDLEIRSERIGIPIKNQYGITTYIEILKKIGFNSIAYIDISENVIPYSATEISNKNGWRTETTVNLPKESNVLDNLIQNFNESTTIEKYYLIKAVK